MNKMKKETTKRTAEKEVAKKLFITLAALSLVFSIAACDSTPSIYAKQTHIGTKGVTMSFVKGMPPSEIYAGTDLQIALDLKNEGAWDIKNAKLKLGVIPSSVKLKLDSDEDPGSDDEGTLRRYDVLEGKSPMNPLGARRLVMATASNIQAPDIGDEEEVTFIATACYGYKTESSFDICIDPQRDEPGVQQKKACDAKPTYRVSGGQGAPIAVTKLEQEMLSLGQTRKVRAKIYLQNMGKGWIYKLDEFHRPCSAQKGQQPQENEFGIVEIGASISGKKMDCNLATAEADNFRFRITNEKDSFVLCQLQLPPEAFSAYNSVITITSAYGYVEDTSTTVKVKKLYNPEIENTEPSAAKAAGTTAGAGSESGECCVSNSLSCADIGKTDAGNDGVCGTAGGEEYYPKAIKTKESGKEISCCVSKTKLSTCSSPSKWNDKAGTLCGNTELFYSQPVKGMSNK